jgi:sporulation protein YlmC with PRC-barrel domain
MVPKLFAYVAAIGVLLAAPPLLAQTLGPSIASASDSSQGASTSASATDAQSSGDFITQQALDEWRASKLVGVGVYGADQKKVGSIKDVLMDHDGAAKAVVIGVGGFLGIGAKDVAVPFKSMQWRTEGRNVVVGSQPVGGAPATIKTDPAATEASQGYPDMAIIAMTEEQLKAAPDFRYAPSPMTNSLTGASMTTPAAAGGAMNATENATTPKPNAPAKD